MLRPSLLYFCLLVLLTSPVCAQVVAVPNSMNFQGRLTRPDGTPVANGNYSVRFRLYDAPTGGNILHEQTVNPAVVKNGAFAVTLSGFPANTFAGNLWLEVRIGTELPLTPRQPLSSVAYAMKADSVKDGAITSASIADGSITTNKFADSIFNPLVWLLNGNTGATNGFLGTTEDRPLEFRVNNRRAVRYQYAERTPSAGNEYRSINVLGGADINSIDPGVVGATIAGGGQDFFSQFDRPNRVMANFGTIGGGWDNIAGGERSTVAGGSGNNASAADSTIGGGFGNITNGLYSTIVGGIGNFTGGERSTVAGGSGNSARGAYSFAAGHRANADHDGAFVWADSPNANFASTGVNQFLIRAGGGVGINTNTPGNATLHARGGRTNVAIFGGDRAPVGISVFESNRTTATNLFHLTLANNDVEVFYVDGTGRPHGTGSYLQISDARFKRDVVPIENALDAILQLRGITYAWDTGKWKERGLPEGRQIGFLAQEVEKVLPELVSTDRNGYKSVSYADAVPVLVEAIKQQQKRIEERERRVERMEQELADLRALVAQFARKRP